MSRELGHGGMALANRGDGHLGTVHYRTEHVEYPVSMIGSLKDDKVRPEVDDR